MKHRTKLKRQIEFKTTTVDCMDYTSIAINLYKTMINGRRVAKKDKRFTHSIGQ